MTSWQIVRIVAGTFILLSLAMGVPGSPLFVSPWWLAFTAFVGANLLQSGANQVVPDGVHRAQARRATGSLSDETGLSRLQRHQSRA